LPIHLPVSNTLFYYVFFSFQARAAAGLSCEAGVHKNDKYGDNYFSTMIRSLAIECKFANAESYTMRSCRRAMLTAMNAAGVSNATKMISGRHKSAAANVLYQESNVNAHMERSRALGYNGEHATSFDFSAMATAPAPKAAASAPTAAPNFAPQYPHAAMMHQPMMMGPPPPPMMMAPPPMMMPMYQQQYHPWMMQPPMGMAHQYVPSYHHSVPMAPTAHHSAPQYYIPAPMAPNALPTTAKARVSTNEDYQEESSSDEEEFDY
jgi:hypothetical protein